MNTMTDAQRTEYEAAAFRRLTEHLRNRSDVQNIDMMNLAGFCRNCLSNWFQEAANAGGTPLNKAQAREEIYGMPYEQWREKYQTPASTEQLNTFAAQKPDHG